MSVDEVKEKTSSTWFYKWNRYLDEEWTRRTKLEHYLAHIYAQLVRANAKHPRRIKSKDFFLNFVLEEKGKGEDPDYSSMTEEQLERHKKSKTANSKLFWGMILSVPKKPPVKKGAENRPDSVSRLIRSAPSPEGQTRKKPNRRRK